METRLETLMNDCAALALGNGNIAKMDIPIFQHVYINVLKSYLGVVAEI